MGAFIAYLLTGNVEACADLLVSTKRLPEAAMFVRTYLPSRIDDVVALWKKDLSAVSVTAAESLASPSVNPDQFPDLNIGLQVQQMFLAQRDATKASGMPGIDYSTAKDDLELNLIELIKARQGGGETKEEDPVDSSADDADAAAETERVAAEEAAEAEAEAARIEAENAAAEAERLAAEATAAK